jgi:hypothetical protein
MLNWLNAYHGLAIWVIALAILGLLACGLAAFNWLVALQRRMACARLCAALQPVRSLCECARTLREVMEGEDGLRRLVGLDFLRDGTLAQRIRDVRAVPVENITSDRAIEAVYQAREAAAALMTWLEQLTAQPGQGRARIQVIWKSLHDSAGNLERDLSRIEESQGRWSFAPSHVRR